MVEKYQVLGGNCRFRLEFSRLKLEVVGSPETLASAVEMYDTTSHKTVMKNYKIPQNILKFKLILFWSRDSAVGIATGYELDGRGVRVRVPIAARCFCSPRSLDRFRSYPRDKAAGV
jgi:hypothetical protein